MKNLKPTFPVTIQARHMQCTDSIVRYAETKLARLKLAYPRVIDAKVIADHSRHGEKAEIILHCANNIVLEADTESRDLYEAIDLTLEKIERQMRKQKTRRLRSLGHS